MADADHDRPRRVQLIVDGIHDPDATSARSVVVDGATIVWVGEDPDDAPPVDRVVTMPGAWVTPAFVDAHVHATATGLQLRGLDLRDVDSRGALLARLRAYAAEHDDDPLLGSGWQEDSWPDPRPPTSAEIAPVASGRRVQLDRVDGHSCLVDPSTLVEVAAHTDDGVDRDPHGRPTGWLRETAAQAARTLVWKTLSPSRLHAARTATVRHAVRLGVASLHEMGVPGLSSLDDALAWRSGDWDVDVQVWWADLDVDAALDRGLWPGGDLFLDGAIGSRTAAVSGGYRDGPALGGLFHRDDDVADFFVRCTRAGVGGGVHAIGDEAIEQAVGAIEEAARHVDADALRACRHRIEHVELPRDDHARRMARLGVVASMQPAFDACWGGRDGLYARRFGPSVSLASNPFAALAAAGVPLAFGSDSTVTPMAPWAGVRAACTHRGGHSIDPHDALRAATLGGRWVARQSDVGSVRPGQGADLAVWDGDPLADLHADAPRCVLLFRQGVNYLQ
jgi:hypothetical protein